MSKRLKRSQIIISKETFYNSPGCLIPLRWCCPIRIVRVCFNSSYNSPPHKQNSINRMGFEKGGGVSKRFSSLATIIGHFQIITQNDRGNRRRWPQKQSTSFKPNTEPTISRLHPQLIPANMFDWIFSSKSFAWAFVSSLLVNIH